MRRPGNQIEIRTATQVHPGRAEGVALQGPVSDVHQRVHAQGREPQLHLIRGANEDIDRRIYNAYQDS